MPYFKILGTILEVEKGVTQTDRPKNKEMMMHSALYLTDDVDKNSKERLIAAASNSNANPRTNSKTISNKQK